MELLSQSNKSEACLKAEFSDLGTTCRLVPPDTSHNDDVMSLLTDLLHYLPWAAHVFLWVVAPVYLFYLMRAGKSGGLASRLMTAKTSITFFMVSLTMIQMSRSGFLTDDVEEDLMGERFSLWTRLVSLILAEVVVRAENSRGCLHSLPLFLFWTLTLLSDSLILYRDFALELFDGDMTAFMLSIFGIGGVLIQLVLSSLPETSVLGEDAHPDELTSIPGKISLSWVTKIAAEGYRNGLKEEDVPKMATQDRCKSVCPPFEKAWTKETERIKPTPIGKTADESEISDTKEEKVQKVNLLKVLLTHFGPEFFTYQLIKLAFDLTTFVHPVLMGYLLLYFQNRDTEPAWKGYATVLAMFAYSIMTGIGHRKVWTSVDRISKQAKIAIKMAVYKKILSARNDGRKYITTGEIVSLVGEECDSLVNCSNIFFLLISIPLQVTIAMFMLYQQLHYGAFVAVGIFLLLIPVNTFISRNLKKLEKEKGEVKDKRVKIMNEVLNGIKVLKLYAWEKSFLKKVMDVRDEEVKLLKKISILQAGIDFMFRAIPFIVRASGFVTFVVLGGFLDPATAFVTSSLFQILSHPLSRLYLIIPDFVRASEALKRLNKFLNLEEIPDDIVTRNVKSNAAIKINDGTFSWTASSEKSCLRNIHLKVPEGKLVAVVGMVGSGKSSLLSAILGEMEKVEGEVTVQGSTAYVPQEAWVLNTPLRENILFGSVLDNEKYNKVLNACALRDDLKLLSSGDRTLIGEKGINLSGGQKQRVSMARAVYADTDVYLLDDPLSAVDAHVGKHIFNNVIGRHGLLQAKTRVMVTHGVHWLPFVDTIVVMKDGQVSETGSYKQLLDHDGAFAQFVRELNKKDAGKEPELERMKQKVFLRLTSLDEGKELPESDGSTSEEGDALSDEDRRSEGEDTGKKWHVSKETREEEKPITDNDNDDAYEEDEEDTKTGTVGRHVYFEYLNAVGFRYVCICLIVFSALLYFRESKEWAMGIWSDDTRLANQSLAETPEYKEIVWGHAISFALCGGGEIVMAFFFITTVLCRACEAAKQHHNELLVNILRSPMAFFDTTPNGRIISRFGKDVAAVDGLGGCLRFYIVIVSNLILFFMLVLYNIPKIIPFVVPVLILFVYLQQMFLVNNRQLRRYETKARSKIFVHLNETLNGTESIRAYEVQKRFIGKMEETIENFMKFQMAEHWFRAWFGMRMLVIGSFVTLASGLLLLTDETISPGQAGLLLMYATHFFYVLSSTLEHASHTETELISLERVIEYSNKPTEAAWETKEDLSPAWPQNGEIVLDNYQTRYRDGLDLVLKGVSCRIESGEKIGIVGRTGAGKSSLTMALFRLVEAVEGKISMNGQHIAPLGLHDLRDKLTILPQDPVIFGGTLRMNLDPFGEKSTEEIWDALKHSHLMEFVESLPDRLEHECGEGGKNLSMGQRQLVCLARTLLRQSNVLVLDEATAGVDMETDELIQQTIRREFRACTVLTIAHRLNTVMDYDRIMVLDSGQIKEFDTPKALLADTNSAFYSMAKDAKLV